MTTNLTPPKRLILTSSSQVVMLARSNPQLATNIPKLAPLVPPQPLPTEQAGTEPVKKPCACGGGKFPPLIEPPKQVVEDILSSLTPEDFLQIKNILSLDQLCYYKRNAALDVLELFCT